MTDPEAKKVIRFGTFEVDPRTGELRKNGLHVKLQDQPFQVLLALLVNPGEVVTREALRAKLWPADTFVDFDHGLNAAVKRLREALGDTAENPRFVETLPRRGYRFIAPVEGGGEKGAVAQPISSELDTAAAESAPRIRKHWLAVAMTTVSIIAVALLSGIWLLLPQRQPRILGVKQLTKDGKPKDRVMTDGSWLYVSEEDDDGIWRIKRVSVTGGDPTTISVPLLETTAVMFIQDISPDHDRLLVWKLKESRAGDGSLWIVPLTGASPRPLTDLGVGAFGGASWSPDGQMMVVSRGSDLLLARGDGTEPQKLATIKDGSNDKTEASARWPAWSPDGKSVRFNVTDAKTGSSFFSQISSKGGEPHEVTPNREGRNLEGNGGRWTPDGRYFVFARSKGDTTAIWALGEPRFLPELKGRDLTQLTVGEGEFGFPAISPDGKKIFAVGYMERGESQRYDRKSGQFVPLSPALSADCCVYSNDGQWMAYVSFPDGSLWRGKSDGSQRQQLTWPPMSVLSNLHWSPDGKEIAFSGQLPGKPWKTFVIPTEGGKARQLTQDECPEADANWSPDGTQMVFGAFTNFVSGTSCPVIVYILDLKTHQRSIVPGSDQLCYPKWSPDGRRLLAQSAKSGGSILIYDFATGKWSELIRAPEGSGVAYLQWSRDSKTIYYRMSGPAPGMYATRIADQKTEKLAGLTGIVTTGNNWDWAAVDPNGNPLILRVIHMNEIYALDFEAP